LRAEAAFFFAVSVLACFDVSVVGVVIVGETDPAAVAGNGAPPASPGVAPAPIVSKPLRGPFEHAASSVTAPIAIHRTSLCTIPLLLSSTA
jgi:hypothetical protein